MNKVLKSQLQQVPTDPGIYKYYNADNEILYVGKAVNLKNRVKSYFVESSQSPKTKALVDEIDHMEYIVVRSEMDALILEANLIKEFKPRYNIILKDDKSHLYIKITLYEDWPRVSTCRATDIAQDPKATYFGPFPSGGTVKSTLRLLRRIFPYVAHNQPDVPGRRRPPQSYFYYNLPLESSVGPTDKRLYRHQIFQLVRFLEGKRQAVAAELEKEMKSAAKRLNFEQAALIKRQLDGLAYITQKTISPDDYISNPELVAEKRQLGLRELAETLANYWPELVTGDGGRGTGDDMQPAEQQKIQSPISNLQPSDLLRRIECYDISNISGQFAVGSMVVFEAGVPLKSDYRRFRIKCENVPNDVAMLEEVLKRRFKRLQRQPRLNRGQGSTPIESGSRVKRQGEKNDTSFSAIPDLIIIDGGKGQLSTAQRVVTEYGLVIPIVGLAKREEELVLPVGRSQEIGDRRSEIEKSSDVNSEEADLHPTTYNLKPKRSSAHGAIARNEVEAANQITAEAHFTSIRLARGSEALFIIQRIRDEAHRFAITYHRKLRAKNFLPERSK